MRWRKSRAGTGAQPLQVLKFAGRSNPPVVALLLYQQEIHHLRST
ncbi:MULTISPECIES: hypothetical protein [Pseudanabaena]|nr:MULTISPECIES: hypothetical protein [Pseudanabaena]MEA5489087.1 hypothetical protein [Pseudanabaena sp. CCNP1317]WGS73075.1 hypothetical protein OA858_03335 [Pseudanabaena galeata CCNP1313]